MAWQQIFAPLARLGRESLDVLLPPLCLRCDANVAETGSLCAACWRQLTFIAAPRCPCCGLPYELARGDLLCPACLADPPPYGMARAAVTYDEASRPLVLGFKHADQTHLSRAMARMMAQSGHDALAGNPILVPVPLHRRRLFRRCYNQSALLAQAIAGQQGLRCVPDLLIRKRHTPPQARLKAAERARNVRAAFAVMPRRRAMAVGQCIVLVDDVMTTGATIRECCAALRQAGAAEIRVLTFARTI